jgi:Tol biopolymer transport system component
MRMFTRNHTAALILLGLLASCGGSNDSATTPPNTPAALALAPDDLVFNSNRNGHHQVFTMKTNGSAAKPLSSDAAFDDWWPRISPDRKRVLFYRAPKGQHDNYAEAALWVMNADGSDAKQLRAKGSDGWTLQGHAEWSPNGQQIAMFGSVGATLQIFVTNAQGQQPVAYTNRPGINTDVSWSPDGQTLLFNGCPSAACTRADYEIYAMPATPLATPARLTNNSVADYDPYFSPDGTSIAWLQTVNPDAFPTPAGKLGAWGIRIANADGSNARDLINDGQINSKPAWSLDGQSIYFHRMEPPDYRFRVFRIGRDGAGLTELTTGVAGSHEYPAN